MSHCAVPGCFFSRKRKKEGEDSIGLFKIHLPQLARTEQEKNHREELTKFILKLRDPTKGDRIKDMLHRETAALCEKHFDPKDVFLKGNRKCLRLGAIPHSTIKKSCTKKGLYTRMASHCILPGCTSYRRKCFEENKIYLISVVAYPRINKEWKRDLFEFCCRYRERSTVFELARKGTAGICGRHFKKSDFIFMKRMKIIPGRMPSLNLPVRRSARIHMKRGDNRKSRIPTGVECSAYGCNKRRKPHSKKAHIRSDSEGSEDEESKEKRKHLRTFHPFPSDPVLMKRWLVNVRRKSWIPTSKSIICSDHFKEEDIVRSGYTAIRLRDGAMPTRFKALKKNLKDSGDGELFCERQHNAPTLLDIPDGGKLE